MRRGLQMLAIMVMWVLRHRNCLSVCRFHTLWLCWPPIPQGPMGSMSGCLPSLQTAFVWESSAGVFPLNPGLERSEP